MPDVFSAIVEVATARLGLDFAALMLREPADPRLSVRAQRGFDSGLLAAAVSTIRQLPEQPAEAGTVWVVPETLGQENVNQELTAGLGVRSLVQIPISYQGANGVFLVGYGEPHGWTPEEVRLYESLAQRASLAIENARLFEESQSRAREMEALYR
jgi:GAF domain-containing protein